MSVLANCSMLGAVMGAQQERDVAPGIPESSGEKKYTQVTQNGVERVREVDTEDYSKHRGKHLTQTEIMQEGCLEVTIFEPGLKG